MICRWCTTRALLFRLSTLDTSIYICCIFAKQTLLLIIRHPDAISQNQNCSPGPCTNDLSACFFNTAECSVGLTTLQILLLLLSLIRCRVSMNSAAPNQRVDDHCCCFDGRHPIKVWFTIFLPPMVAVRSSCGSPLLLLRRWRSIKQGAVHHYFVPTVAVDQSVVHQCFCSGSGRGRRSRRGSSLSLLRRTDEGGPSECGKMFRYFDGRNRAIEIENH